MKTAQFLRSILPPLLSDEWYIYGRKYGSGFRHTACKTIDALTDLALSESAAGYDSYFALGSFYEGSLINSEAVRVTGSKDVVTRKAAAVRAFASLWVDLDCGEGKDYEDQDAGRTALTEFVEATGLQYSYLVSSGNGLHVYWALSYPYFVSDDVALTYIREVYPEADMACWAQQKEQHKLLLRAELAGRFYSICRAFNLRYDKGAADSTRVLRVPGTNNYKDPENPKHCEILEDTGLCWQQTEFNILCSDLIAAHSISVTVRPTNAIVQDTSIAAQELKKMIGEDPLAEGIDRIVDGCEQLRTMGFAPEPLWRDAICLCLQCVDGAAWAHKLSAMDTDRYSEAQVDEYIARSKAFAVRCNTFNSKRDGVCLNCQYYQKISTPLQIARMEVEAETSPQTTFTFPQYTPQPIPFDERKGFPFFCDARGVWKKNVSTDGTPTNPTLLTDQTIEYLFGTIEESVGAAESGVAYDVYRIYYPQESKEFTHFIPVKYFFDSRKLTEWCANARVLSFVQQKDLVNFMNTYSRQAWRQKSVRIKYAHYGWQKDKMKGLHFVLDKYTITAKGAEIIAPTESELEERSYPFTHKGTLEEWKKIPELYKTLNQPLGQFAMCMAFAAPFMYYGVGEAKNCVFNIYSRDGGAGKSHLLKACSSVYGNPHNAFLQHSASSSALQKIMASYRYLPVFIDELGNKQDDQLAEFIFTSVNGVEKQKLNKDSSRRKTGQWSTVVFTTANRPLKDVMSKVYANTDAGVLRVIDCSCDFAFSCASEMRPLIADSFTTLEANYGMAGPEFVFRVLNDPARLETLSAIANAFTVNNGFAANERFYSYPFAIALTIGRWAVEYGLLPYDMEYLQDWVLNTLVPAIRGDDAELSMVDYLEDLGEYINAGIRKNCIVVKCKYRPDNCDVSPSPIGMIDPYVIQYPTADLTMRYELENECFLFSQKAFSNWCRTKNLPVRTVLKQLRKDKYITSEDGTKSLSKDVKRYVTVPVKCHQLTKKFLEKNEFAFDSDAAPVPTDRLTAAERKLVEEEANKIVDK